MREEPAPRFPCVVPSYCRAFPPRTGHALRLDPALILGAEQNQIALAAGPHEIHALGRVRDHGPPVREGLSFPVWEEHGEDLGTIEAVARAKVELLEKISEKGRVILNGDDALLMKEASRFRRDVITYGLEPEHPIRAEKIRSQGRKGVSFKLQCFGQSESVMLSVPGRQNVMNALAASAIAFCLDESLDRIAQGLNCFKGIKGRFTISQLSGDVTLVDDTYNANPSSLKAAMDTVKDLVEDTGGVIVCLGEMLELGEETLVAHLEAGHMVAELGPSCFVAMGEHARQMIEGAVSRGFPADKAVAVSSVEDMVQKIEEVMRAGDLILLKGSRQMRLEKVAESLANNHPIDE